MWSCGVRNSILDEMAVISLEALEKSPDSNVRFPMNEHLHRWLANVRFCLGIA